MVFVLRLLEELPWRVCGRLPRPEYLDELNEDAVEPAGMEERDPGAVCPLSRPGADQADPGRARPRQCSIDVRYLERQMVNAFSPFGQEAAQRAGGLQGLEQLDLGARQLNECHPHVLLGKWPPRALVKPEPSIERRGGVDPSDDDAEVRQPSPGIQGTAHPAYTTAGGR